MQMTVSGSNDRWFFWFRLIIHQCANAASTARPHTAWHPHCFASAGKIRRPDMRRRNFLSGTAAAAAVAQSRTTLAGGANVLRFVPQVDLTVVDPVMTTAYVTRNH